MHTRLTFISIQEGKAEEVKRIYNEELVPVVKSQKGNTGVRLLESTDNPQEYVSLTEWTSKADADAYQSSGTYQTLVNKIKDMYTDKPVLKTYEVIESKVMASMQ